MSSTFAGLLYFSSILIENGEMTIGDILSIILYLIQVVFKFGEIAWIIGEIFKVKGATMKILELMQVVSLVNSRGGTTIP